LKLGKGRHEIDEVKTLVSITANKREIKDFPKLPSVSSFISKTLHTMLYHKYYKFKIKLILLNLAWLPLDLLLL